ncbi:carbohydrate ABC transporter permease [Clostridium manihotivorum]|uniref:Carbohydrate ABC transporter permease n=1 Tax=Clostridium manihotivorum TaxID=2320868 RepID=A0A3R5X3C5_9CLOT|nr:carbohydrate ABC transporter permease [Clostridium manihotivorum]QAA33455.1 carbohydrate ABC transporter permease [Clostridium manihotivorum]
MFRKKAGQVLLHLVLLVMVVIALLPFLNMISTSLIPNTYVLPSKPQIIPKQFYLGNYITAWTGENFSRYFINSIFVTVANTVLTIFVSSLSGYGFARLNFPGKKIIFNIYIFSLMMPAVLALISQFTILQGLHLVDTYTGLLLLYVSGGIAGNTFFLKGFFETIPRELEESVIMDGGNKWTIYRNIILPLSKPALATMAIGAFSGTWMEVFTALTVIKTQSKRTLPIAIKLLQNGKATQWGVIFAAAILVLIPIIIIFIVFNKQFIKSGGSEGAVKG